MASPSILLFDGHCILCNSSLDFVMKRDSEKKLLFAAIQSPAGQRVLMHYGLPLNYLESLVFVEKGKVYQGSTAALRVARKLRRGWPLLYPLILLPASIREPIYQWIGTNRYTWFGRKETCRMPNSSEKEWFLAEDYPL